MSDREGDGATVVMTLVIIVLLLAVGGAVGMFFFRQASMLRNEAQRALAAEMRAREQADVLSATARMIQQDAQHRVSDPDDKSSNRASDSSVVREIEAVLREQESAWNEGDIESFMKHYWKSEALTFSSGGKTTRGWDQTMARYRERYPTRQSMGKVSFQELEIHPLGDSSAYVLGRWRVDRDQEPLHGNFSLVLRRMDDRWFIVHDHTSRLEEPKAESKAESTQKS